MASLNINVVSKLQAPNKCPLCAQQVILTAHFRQYNLTLQPKISSLIGLGLKKKKKSKIHMDPGLQALERLSNSAGKREFPL